MEDTFAKRVTGIIIHGFAAAHAVAAAALSQTVAGDDAVLTLLTTSMIISITLVNDRKKNVGAGLAIAGCLAGFFLGTRGALFIIKWIPFAGNAANSITTMIVTEILGWTTYVIVKENVNVKNMKFKDKLKYLQRGYTTQKSEKDISEKLYNSMSSEDKAEVNQIIREMGKKDLPDSTFELLNKRLETIIRQYA